MGVRKHILRAAILWLMAGLCAAEAPREDSKQESARRWQVFWGVSSFRGRLTGIERQIDVYNQPSKLLVPGWRDPETFKDKRDHFELWDLQGGFGRDVSAKWVWFISAGAGVDRILNRQSWSPLLKVSITFKGAEWYALTGLSYYPFGQPCLASGSRNQFVRALLATRPYVALACGFAHAGGTGESKLTVPGGVTLFRIYKKIDYNAGCVSPRIGIETPVGKNDSLLLQAGYPLFTDHQEDLGGLTIQLLHRHRF